MHHFARTRFLSIVSVVAAAALVMGFTSFTPYVSPAVPITRVSTDPYTNNTSMHQTEVEPDTYSWGSTIVSAFQVGRFSDGGASNVGWATSTNSGATWTNGFLPGVTIYNGGPHQRATDPAVAYDRAHNIWLIVTLVLEGGGTGDAVLTSRSTDGGLTWLNPTTVVSQGGLDKTWIACDSSSISPYYGHCYTEWDNNSAGNIVQMSTSTDGGATWGPVRTPAGSPSGLGGQPLVGPSGLVIVPVSGNYGSIFSIRSTDGGATWSSATTVSSVTYHSNSGNLRTYPMPSAEIDPQGRVYTVWQDCRFRSGCSSNDIVFSTSLDGLTWSAVTRIPIDAVSSTVDHFIPGIAVDLTRTGPPARLGLYYYYYPVSNCSSSNCQLYVGFVSSGDGGATWSAPVQVAGPMTNTWLPLTNQGYMVGDYMSGSFDTQGRVHSVFAVAGPPNGGTLDEAMYAPNSGLPALSGKGPIAAGGDKVLYFPAKSGPGQLLPTSK